MNQIAPLASFLSLPPCDGTDTFADRVFLTGNEQNREAIFHQLANEKIRGNAFLGTSCFYSLDAASVRPADSNQDLRYLLILDRSLRVEYFWKEAKALIRTSKSRHELIKTILTLIEKNKEIYFAKPWGTLTTDGAAEHEIIGLQEAIKKGISWLSDDIRYSRIQKIFKEKRFFFLRQNFCDPGAISSLAKQLQEKDLVLDTLYCSNIFECCSSYEEEENFITSVKLLVGPHTLFVDTKPREFRHMGPLKQRVNTPPQLEHYYAPPKSGHESDSDGFTTLKASDFAPQPT